MKVVELPAGWRPSPEAIAERNALADELRKRYPPKPRPIKPDGMTQEEFILSLQSPSCQATMKRTDEEQAAWRARPLPENWLANPEAKTNDESVGVRILSEEERSHVEAIRRRPKNSLGQSEKSSASDERKQAAVDAFIFTPPANVTKAEVEARAVNLIRYKSEPPREVWVELPWHKAMWHWLKGNKIRPENK